MFNKRRPVFCLVMFTLLVPAVSFLGGCSDDSAGIGSNTFIRLLNMVPPELATSGKKPIITFLIDYNAIFKEAGVTFTNIDELREKTTSDQFAKQVISLGSYITGFSSDINFSTINKKYVGYDLTAVDAEIQFGQSPYDSVAAIGKYDPEAIRNALLNQNDWPAQAISEYIIEKYDGVTIHSWGDGLKRNVRNSNSPPIFERYGYIGPLAVTDRNLFYSYSIETLKSMINASKNKIQSIADLPGYTAVANTLSDLGSYAAVIADGQYCEFNIGRFVTDAINPEPEFIEEVKQSWGPLLKRFSVFGTGTCKDAQGTYMAIVLYCPDKQIALENVDILKERVENVNSLFERKKWSEVFTITDVQAKGNIVIAKMYTRDSLLFAKIAYVQDTLLIYDN